MLPDSFDIARECGVQTLRVSEKRNIEGIDWDTEVVTIDNERSIGFVKGWVGASEYSERVQINLTSPL